MNKILTIMWKDVRVLFGDWASVALIIAGPLVLALGLGLVTGSFGGDDGAPAIGRIPVLLVDQDGGQFATALTDLFAAPELSDLVAPEALADADAARARVAGGEATAAIIIPPGFSDSFLPDPATGEMPPAVAVQLYADPGAPIGAAVVRGIVEEFTARVDTGVAGVRVGLTGLATSGAVPPSELAAIGRQMGEGMGGDATAAASLIRVNRVSTTTSDSPNFNPLAYFAPSMALLFLMYAVTLGARTLLAERREGTLPRMLAAPVTAGQVLGGKVGGIFLGGFIQLGALIVLTTLLFQLNWGNPLSVLLLVIAAALAATGWGLLIASVAANAGQITNVGMAVTLLFGILGGSFVPLANAWPVLDVLSRITPNRWALDGFTALASGEPASAVFVPIAGLLVMAAVLFAVAALLFRRRQGALLTA